MLLIAATAGLARFGTVAIDGTKIAANASIDANRGRDWFERHAAEMTADAEADGPSRGRRGGAGRRGVR